MPPAAVANRCFARSPRSKHLSFGPECARATHYFRAHSPHIENWHLSASLPISRVKVSAPPNVATPTASKDHTLILLRHLLLRTALAASATLAQAGTITYNLTGASTSAGLLTGMVELDTATNLITSARLTFNNAALGSPVFTTLDSSAADNGFGQAYISGPGSGPLNNGGQAALFFNTANVGSGTLTICTMAAACGTRVFERSLVEVYSSNGTMSFDLSDGIFSVAEDTTPAVAATPEPSSLALLGAGIFGLAVLTLFKPLRIPTRKF